MQARAAGLDPITDMNPVLLKPQTDIGAQVVVHGRVTGNAEAREYHRMKPDLLVAVLDAYRRLADDAELILVEGAGSPAEMNLRAGDIANMGFAEAADIPVALIGDIERGGVIAALVGTWTLLPPDERTRLCGYIVNRFRGDVTLFDNALPIIAGHTGLDSFGIVPWFEGARTLPPRTPPRSPGATAVPTGHARRSGSPCRTCRGSPISTTSIRWPTSRMWPCGWSPRASACPRMPI